MITRISHKYFLVTFLALATALSAVCLQAGQSQKHAAVFNQEKSKQLLEFCRNLSLESNLNTMQALLQDGADPNYTENGNQYKQPIHALLKSRKKITELQALAGIRLLLQHGADVCNPFTWKAILRHYTSETIWRLFFEYGLDANSCHPMLKTPLLTLAIQYNNLAAVKALLEHNADPNALCARQDLTPLMAATHMNNLAAAELLVKKGADVTRTNAKGDTVLNVAHTLGHAKLFEYLEGIALHKIIKACNELDLKTIKRFFGTTLPQPFRGSLARLKIPLPHYVFNKLVHQKTCKSSQEDAQKNAITATLLLQIFFQAGLPPTATDAKGVSLLHRAQLVETTGPLKFLLRQGEININCCTVIHKWTPLHYAAMHGRTEHAKLLVEYGADRTLKDIAGNTAYNQVVEGHTNNRDLLLITAPPSSEDSKKDKKQKARDKKRSELKYNFFSAIAAADYLQVKKLLKQGADATWIDFDGRTPLLVASIAIASEPDITSDNITNYQKTVSTLLDHGTQINATDPGNNLTILHYAMYLTVELINRIAKQPGVVIDTGKAWATPLIDAIADNAFEQAQALIRWGGNTNILHHFSDFNFIASKMVRLLLENGAQPSQETQNEAIPQRISALFSEYKKNPEAFTSRALKKHGLIRKQRQARNRKKKRLQGGTSLTDFTGSAAQTTKSAQPISPVSPRLSSPKVQRPHDTAPQLHELLGKPKAVIDLLKKELPILRDNTTRRPFLLDIIIKSARNKDTAMQYQSLLEHILKHEPLLCSQLSTLINVAKGRGDGHANLFHAIALLDNNNATTNTLLTILKTITQELQELTQWVINQTDEWGNTPLKCASSKQMKLYLQSLGAHAITAPLEPIDSAHSCNDDEKSTEEAGQKKSTQTPRLWSEALLPAIRANKTKAIRSIIHQIIATERYPRAVVQQQMNHGKTFLHIAVEEGQLEAAATLLAPYRITKGSPRVECFTFHSRDKDGKTALDRAKRILSNTPEHSQLHSCYKQMVALLTKKIPDVPSSAPLATVRSAFRNSIQLFYTALKTGNVKRMAELLKQKPDLAQSHKPKTTKSALRYAVETGNTKAVGLLLSHGAPLESGLHGLSNRAESPEKIDVNVLLQLASAFDTCMRGKDNPANKENHWTTFYNHVHIQHFPPTMGGNSDTTKDRFLAAFLGESQQRAARAIFGLVQLAYKNMLTDPGCVTHLTRHGISSDCAARYATRLLDDHEIGLHEAWVIRVHTPEVKADIIASIRNGHMKIVTAYPVK